MLTIYDGRINPELVAHWQARVLFAYGCLYYFWVFGGDAEFEEQKEKIDSGHLLL